MKSHHQTLRFSYFGILLLNKIQAAQLLNSTILLENLVFTPIILS